MAAEVFGSDQYQVVDFQSYSKMCSILELVAYVAAKVGHMPAHAERSHRTQYATRVEFPGVIGIIQVAMRGEVVVGDHTLSPVLSFCLILSSNSTVPYTSVHCQHLIRLGCPSMARAAL